MEQPCSGSAPPGSRFAQLLVSVRSTAEVETAITAGVDIIDLKEPRSGALSPTDPVLWRQTAARWDELDQSGRPPGLSAALGEWREARACARYVPARFDFAKVGPSRCGSQSQLRRLWTEIRGQLNPRIELVGVAYADWQDAGCIAPNLVFQLASEFGLRRCLLDTFTKNGRSSVGRMGISSLLELATTARRLGLWWTLAGSIRVQDIARFRSLEVAPDCLGVRGDVCQGAREGTLQSDRIRIWLQELQAQQIPEA